MPVDDNTFYARLKASNEDAWRVADLAFELGILIEIPKVSIRPKEADRYLYADKGVDLYLNGHPMSLKNRRMVKFSGPHDYPKDKIIVENMHVWGRHPEKPKAVIYTDSTHTGMLVVCTAHPDRWWQESYDNGRQVGEARCLLAGPSEYYTVEDLLTWVAAHPDGKGVWDPEAQLATSAADSHAEGR